MVAAEAARVRCPRSRSYALVASAWRYSVAGAQCPANGSPMTTDPTRLLTAADVGEMLRVPTSWVYAEARAGRIPHVTLGRYRRFRLDAIDEWVRELERGPTPYRKHRPSGERPEG